MSEDKVKYGIDLGTTNSAICRVENGDPRIIKSDQFQKDTTPSCVSINKKQVVSVGDLAFNARAVALAKLAFNPDAAVDDSFIEFKRTMGSDKEFKSVHLGRNLSSEELSSEVLKKLKSYVSDDDVRSAVITVPAKYTAAQINATQKAAELAGFEYVELLQEPTAASIAYGIKSESSEGKWVVFDFGGGTFDAALMSVEDGIMKVIDTEGDNYLGGKNLDLAITDSILIPYLKENYAVSSHFESEEKINVLKGALKKSAEQAKIDLSTSEKSAVYQEGFIEEADDGEEVDLDLTITLDQYSDVVAPVFQKAIDITLDLIKRNDLSSRDLSRVVMVGGPTLQQTCRKMLKEQMDCEIDVSIDPMTAVADGAAVNAETRILPGQLKVRDKAKVQLKMQYEATTVEVEEYVTVSLDKENTHGEIPEKLHVEISNQDGSWNSGRSEMIDGSDVVFVQLNEGKTNTYDIKIFDGEGNNVDCQPSSFSMLQGVKVAVPTLPYSAGIAVNDYITGKPSLALMEGIERNQNLPAKGKGVYNTSKDLRPGRSDDKIDIIVYEGEDGDDGINPDLCNLMAKAKVTGDDLSGLVPENSPIEVTVKVDESRRVSGSVFIKHIDEDIDLKFDQLIEKVPSREYLQELINKWRATLSLDEDGLFDSNESEVENLNDQLDKLESDLEKGGADADIRMQIESNLRKVLKGIYVLELQGEWPKVHEEIKQELSRLNEVQAQYGNEETKKQVSVIKDRVESVILEKEVLIGRKLCDAMARLKFSLLRRDPNFYIALITDMDQRFDSHEWKNPTQARQLLESAKRSIASRDFTVETLSEQMRGIFGCMKDPRKASSELTDSSRLTRMN